MSTLEVAQDLELQAWMWRIEHAGWAAFVAFLFAAASGLFGDGPLSDRVVTAPDGSYSVEYPRFVRTDSRVSARLRLGAGSTPTPLRVDLSAGYLDEIAIGTVTPQPERVELGPERVTFWFAWDGSPNPPPITFSFEPTSPGLLEGTISLRGQPVALRHVVYP